MLDKDAYDILGVAKTASEAEIKKAYRKLARQHHPDVNPEDAQAEDKFKEISEAYDILSNPEKRRAYDEMGLGGYYAQPEAAREYDEGFAFRQYADIFRDFFGGGQAYGGPLRGEDLSYGLEIDFEEAVRGGKRTLSLEKEQVCPGCQGSGLESEGTACKTCRGRGSVEKKVDNVRMLTTCPTCHGAGRTGQKACRRCGGRGAVLGVETIEVVIPPGVDTGSRLKLTGKGNPGANGGPPGDLFLRLTVRPNPLFSRKGRDIYVKANISLFDAVLGGKVTVPTLDKPVRLKIPPGTQNGQQFRLAGKGVTGGGKAGDEYVEITVTIPKDLSPEARERFQDLKKVMPEGAEAGY